MNVEKKLPEIRFKGFSGEWLHSNLAECTDLLTGNPFNSKEFTSNGFLLVRGMNVKRGYLDTSTNLSEYWPSSKGLERYLLEPEDIVIQMDGALIGKSYAKINSKNLPAILVQRVTRVRCNKVEPELIYQYIQKDFLKHISGIKTETAVPHLSLNDIRNFSVFLPEEQEQTAIGNTFQKLDSLINQHQQKHDQLSNIKKAMLEKMFPKQGETTPEIRFKGFIEKWEEKELGEIGSFASGVGFSENEQCGKLGIPFFKVSDMNLVGNDCYMTSANNYVSDEQILRLNYNPIRERSIIFAKVGAAIFLERKRVAKDFLIDNNMMAFSPTQDINFMKQWFDSISLSRYTQVGALPSFKASDLGKVKLKIPKREEQAAIGYYFQKLDMLINQHQNQITKLNNIKQACLSKMFV